MGSGEALDAALTQHLAAMHRIAAASPAGGGAEWDALMRHYGVAPLDTRERATIVAQMRLSRGAAPAEVRMVLAGLKAWAQGELARMHPAGPDWIRQRVEGLVEQEMASYERGLGIAPPPPDGPQVGPAPASPPGAPSLASIFANAQQTSKEVPWAGMKWKQVGTLTCVHCGGPQEEPADFMCRYCRRPIAGSIKPTT